MRDDKHRNTKIRISGAGVVNVDAGELLASSEAKRQIQAARRLFEMLRRSGSEKVIARYAPREDSDE